MTEEWKPIPGYEGLYDASNMGRIRSHPGRLRCNGTKTMYEHKSKVMAQYCAGRRKEPYICLHKNGKLFSHCVSRLVAMAWHGIPSQGLEVNHINGDYTDNRAENLEWVTKSENILHAFNNGLKPSNSRQVTLINKNGDSIYFYTTAEASRFLGRCRSYIRSFAKRGAYICWAVDGTEYTFEIGGAK